MNIAEKELLLKQDFDEVYEAGKKSQYDEFWDIYQENGNRTNYEEGFAGIGWTVDNFRPKYNITPVGSMTFMFYMTTNLKNVDLTEHLNNLGITLDVSEGVNVYNMFAYSSFSRIPELNLINGNFTGSTFNSCIYLETIDKIILNSGGTQTFASNTFSGCTKLKNLVIEGTIGSNFVISASPLTLNSAKSVINALMDYSGTDKEGAYTITFSTTTLGYLDADTGYVDPDTEEVMTWRDYISSKGWAM